MKSITTWVCLIACAYKEVFVYLHKYTESNTKVTFPQRFAVCSIAVNQEIHCTKVGQNLSESLEKGKNECIPLADLKSKSTVIV